VLVVESLLGEAPTAELERALLRLREITDPFA
jgi:hypothetical protein